MPFRPNSAKPNPFQFTPRVMNNSFARKFGTPAMDTSGPLNKFQEPECLRSNPFEYTTQEFIDAENFDEIHEESSSEYQLELPESIFEHVEIAKTAPEAIIPENGKAKEPEFVENTENCENKTRLAQNRLFQQQLNLSQKMMENLRTTWLTKFQESNDYNSDCWNATHNNLTMTQQQNLYRLDFFRARNFHNFS